MTILELRSGRPIEGAFLIACLIMLFADSFTWRTGATKTIHENYTLKKSLGESGQVLATGCVLGAATAKSVAPLVGYYAMKNVGDCGLGHRR